MLNYPIMPYQNDMKAVVLAGGEGSRLTPYTNFRPKALLKVAGKPIVESLFEKLFRYGFNEITLCINKQFYDQFRYLSESPWNAELIVSPKPMGTAGELYNAKKSLYDEPFLIHYVDEITTIDLSALASYHLVVQEKYSRYAGTLALVKGVQMEVGIAKIRGKLIKRFEEKPKIDFYIWTGVGVLTSIILEYCEPERDLGADVFPVVLNDGYKICAYRSPAYWYDIGQVHHLKLVDRLIAEGKLKI